MTEHRLLITLLVKGPNKTVDSVIEAVRDVVEEWPVTLKANYDGNVEMVVEDFDDYEFRVYPA